MTPLKVLPLLPGEKVKEAGCYGIPLSVHLGQCCEGPSISSTGLRTIELRTPAHYFAESDLNPNREESEDEVDARHFRIGSSAHLLMLEPHLFGDRIVTRPDEWDSWRTNAAKAWRSTQIALGKTVLDPSEMKTVLGVASALRKDPLYREGILDGAVEKSLIWQDQQTGVWLKSRPDAIPTNAAMVTDLKVVTDASPDAVQKAIVNYGYDMQLALAMVGMKAVLGLEIEEVAIVSVEVKQPHLISVLTLEAEMVHWAMRRLRRSINTFAECLKTGVWPGYEGSHGRPVYLPKWQRETYEADLIAKRMPESF